MEQSVGIQFSNSQSSEGDYIILEQAEYPSGTGYTTKANIIGVISSYLYSFDTVTVDCGVEDGTFTTTMYAYPSSEGLNFFTGLTYGTSGDGVHKTITVTETISFKLTNEEQVSYPIKEIVNVSWNGRVFDENGRTTNNPSLSFNGRTVTSDKTTYSQVEITYKTFRVSYKLTISAREDSVENVFQSVFYAVFDGGVVMKEVKAPDGAEDDYTNDTTCGWRSIVNIRDPEDEEPTISQNNKTEYISYCSQEAI